MSPLHPLKGGGSLRLSRGGSGCEALREWVACEGAAHTIATGFGYGISAQFVCEALLANGRADARHVVLDPNQTWRFAARTTNRTGIGVLRGTPRSELPCQVTVWRR